jgi:short-subunit dehydrogenase
MNYTLITGASKGIGYELAMRFAKNGHNIILVSRQLSPLQKLASELEDKYKVNTLVINADLSHPEAASMIYRKVLEHSVSVDYLINNAGFYVRGPFSETSWEDELKLISILCLGHIQLTKLFLAGMIKQGKGGILNVGSTGSFVPGPFNAVYCAAKSFVLSFSEALAEEVSGSGITVTALCPGGTNTAFQDREGRKASFLFPIMDASKVAEKGYKGLMKGKRVVVPGAVNKLQVFIPRMLPRKFMSWLSGKIVSGNT